MKKKNLQSSRQVLECSKLLHVGFLGPIINTSVFSEFSSKKLLVIQFFISTMHSVVSQFGVFHRAVKKYRAEYHQHNSES